MLDYPSGAGFSEGDATFQIRVTKPSVERANPYYHIATTYELTQSRLDIELFNDYKSIMDSISTVFLCKLGCVFLSKYDRSGKQPAWRVRNSGKKGAVEVAKYFTKYPLFSSKYLDFLCWRKAQILIEARPAAQHHKKITDSSSEAYLSVPADKSPVPEIIIDKLLELKLEARTRELKKN